MNSLPARTALGGTGSKTRAALPRHELFRIIALSGADGAQRSGGFRPRRKPHPPEITQGLQRFQSDFPQADFLSISRPNDTKLGGLLRKAVCKLKLRAHFQRTRHSDHGAIYAHDAGMRFFFEFAVVRHRAMHLDRDTHVHAAVLAALFKLKAFVQSTPSETLADKSCHSL